MAGMDEEKMNFLKKNWLWIALILLGVYLWWRYSRAAAAASDVAASAGTAGKVGVGGVLATIPGGSLLATIWSAL